ncbi:MAG: ribose 5-phosphate isomerase B [Deltaproteobacteria bacterium]|jgi:ribose 5-phosphate isomerase B|nr:ribose 5-phosphate isomerase B [Deltaproteobacteria bacterium]MBT6502245.1 ribose 5-phosphate isomerase B [Deltaproteobacteria bacterium]MBT7714643.1 ribose 5-phosphate isomerase B [Deltaproteobacteria bacterium]
MTEKIVIGSDHGGFDLKEKLKEILADLSFEILDMGCFDTSSVHYPEIAQQVSKKIASGEFERGILICGTGIGMSIAANRFPKVRATMCHDHLTARLSREHNNSNILALGARTLGIETVKDILMTWLNTDFTGDRHLTRINMLDKTPSTPF